MLALGRALAARGHDVVLQTWERWRADAEREGLRFAPAPEYHVFPTRERPLKPLEAVVRATKDTRPLVAELRPHAVVADILTLAPALAGELEGVPVATLIPHLDPRVPPGAPPYSLGARPPRTRLGRRLWRATDGVVRRSLELGRDELNETRRRLGLAPRPWQHNGISRELAMVATFPQLEAPWPPRPATEVVGPLLWEPPAPALELAPGDARLVLVAPSTSQDPEQRLLRAALGGLGPPLRARVVVSTNRTPLPAPAPANFRAVDWISYAHAMPRCDVVVCHGGHGTVARALASGCVIVIVPAAGDMNETAARLDWAGVGVRLPPRFCATGPLRLAVRRALAEPELATRAADVAEWARAHDGAARAAAAVERFAVARVDSVRHTN
jgi:UDP:flavonoid glycosyltransferase YjiC (YdhE family)